MIACPSCAQRLQFDIATQRMYCTYCSNSYDPYSFDSETGEAKQEKSFDTYVWTCPSCGGQLDTPDGSDAMGFCPYCGGASLLFDRMRKQWRPKYVIPFSVTKEQCKQAYLAAAKKNRFVSKRYKDPELLEGFRGIYMPYWTYRLLHKGFYYIPAETPQNPNGYDFNIKRYEIEGAINLELDGYAHDASSAFEDRISQNLEPYYIEERKPFAPGFLSGFYTIAGDIPRSKLDEWVVENAKQTILRKLIAPDTQVGQVLREKNVLPQLGHAHVPAEITEVEQCLYPVWFLSYRQGKQLTYAAVNGQTGKVFVDFPASMPRVLALGFGFAALFFVLFLLAGSTIQASAAARISALLFSSGLFFLEHSFCSTVDQSRVLTFSRPSQRYRRKRKWRIACAVISLIGARLLQKAHAAQTISCCAFCILLAGLFCCFISDYIHFQLAIARRRPPQFNRKGAASDEQ